MNIIERYIIMENVKLWQDGKVPYFDPSYGQPETDMTPHIAEPSYNSDGKRRLTGCVIVCPGGGYEVRAPHEGAPVAELFRSNGISSFVLNYRLSPYRYPAMRADINRAVRWVRYHAAEYSIDPSKIAVLGFSAGGHLACMGATHYDSGIDGGDEIDRISSRPDAAILCYSVVTLLEPHTHCGTRDNLLTGVPDREALEKELSGELSVTSDTPPMFLWHTAGDTGVDVENSLNMASALSAAKRPFELHIFPDGDHGLGLAEDVPGTREWGPLAADWLLRMGY